jgi:hypothetical protein
LVIPWRRVVYMRDVDRNDSDSEIQKKAKLSYLRTPACPDISRPPVHCSYSAPVYKRESVITTP